MAQLINTQTDFTEEEAAVFQRTPKAATPAKPEVLAEDFNEVTATSLDDIVAAQYRGGMSVTKIIKANNLSAGKVYGILSRKNVPLRNGQYKTAATTRFQNMKQREKQLIIDDYVADVALEDIFIKYNLNKNAVYKVLDEANIPRKNRVVSTEAAPKKEKVVKAPAQEQKPEEITGSLAVMPKVEPVFEYASEAFIVVVNQKKE